MKKTIALMLAAVMVMSMAACTAQPAATTAAATTAAPTTAAPTTAAPAATEAAKTEAAPAATEAAAPAAGEWHIERPEGLPADYPAKEIVFLYPFNAGGTNEMVARIAFEYVREKEGWKHGLLVKNVTGAGGDVGWTQFMKAEPDYTFTHAPTAQIITALGLGKDYIPENLCYILNNMSDPGVIGVAGDSKYNTFQELIEAARANPGTVSIGCTSATGSEGLAIIQIQRAAGIEFNVIPFDGTTSVFTAVIGHHCDCFCLNVGDCNEWVADGSIKLLAVGSDYHSEFYPEVPTYQECGVDVIQINSRAYAMPKGTNPAVTKYLCDCLMAAFQSEEVREKTAAMNIPWDLQDTETCKQTYDNYYASYKKLWDEAPWM